MYYVKLFVKDSHIQGRGSFADEDICKGSVVWQYKEGYDHVMSQEEFNNLTDEKRSYYERVAYLSPTSDQWVYSPVDDPGNFVNHDSKNYNLDTIIDLKRSPEPIYVANRDIKKGEEITSNYLDFDTFTITDQPDWA